MKKDLGLLSLLAALLAIAASVAVRRALLTLPNASNPLADWSPRQCAIAFAIALIAFIASIIAIAVSDRGLVHPSAELEWVYARDEAARIVSDYDREQQRMQAVRGVVLDSVAFIPSYVALIAIACFALRQPAIGWCAILAGALDYVENGGIFAVLGGITTRLAPLTYAACQLKWLLALGAADFAVITFVMRYVR